jgi:hypothetical protein
VVSVIVGRFLHRAPGPIIAVGMVLIGTEQRRRIWAGPVVAGE